MGVTVILDDALFETSSKLMVPVTGAAVLVEEKEEEEDDEVV